MVSNLSHLLHHAVYHASNLAKLAHSILDYISTLTNALVAIMHSLYSLLGFVLNSANKLGNMLGCILRVLRQLADFLSYNGKATAVLSGSSGLNGSVESQEIGLTRNINDGFHNLADFLRAMAQGINSALAASMAALRANRLV